MRLLAPSSVRSKRGDGRDRMCLGALEGTNPALRLPTVTYPVANRAILRGVELLS